MKGLVNVARNGKVYEIDLKALYDYADSTQNLMLKHGDVVTVGGLELEVRHTPGHSPGGVCFVVQGGEEPLAIVGDVLFAGSIGRTDLMGGSFPVLERSIREQLYTLADETRVVCGHGPDTTIGREKATNPFVSG